MCMKIKKVYKTHYNRRKKAANVINNGCHNWVWKPECNDGTIGIRPRLDMEYLGISNTMYFYKMENLTRKEENGCGNERVEGGCACC
jgi:hypothetical protein